MPAVSFIIPAYNAELYLSDALDSICQQTLSDWEVIVVNDASTDSTPEIVERYIINDNRIRLINRVQNSGSCRQPRFEGIMAAKGQYVCCIDADDWIECEYAEKLLNGIAEYGADIACGRMILCNEKKITTGRMIPAAIDDIDNVLTAKEACERTLGGWRIALAGMMVNSKLYKTYIAENYHMGSNLFYSDELDHRKLLSGTSRVCSIMAHYFYRQHSGSIVHNVSIKSYDILIAKKELINWVYDTFGEGENMSATLREYLQELYRGYCRYIAQYRFFDKSERSKISKILRESYSYIKTFNIVNLTMKERIMLMCPWGMYGLAICQSIVTKFR